MKQTQRFMIIDLDTGERYKGYKNVACARDSAYMIREHYSKDKILINFKIGCFIDKKWITHYTNLPVQKGISN